MSDQHWVRNGDTFTFTWPECRYKLVLDQIREHSDDTFAEITVLHDPAPAGTRGHIHWTKLNLISTVTREKLAKYLGERTQARNGFWTSALEEVCSLTVEEFRKGESFVDLADGIAPKEVAYLLKPLLPLNETTALFADGDSCKGWIALAVGLSLSLQRVCLPGIAEPGRASRVLYLDWESTYEENQRRLMMLSRGLQLQERPRGIVHRRMTRSLADDINLIRRWVSEHKIELVIFDSAIPATGGEAKETAPVAALNQALRLLPCTRLVLGHVSKATAATTGQRGRMYGNVMYENLARSVWEVRSDTEVLPYQIGLFHTKVNMGMKAKPFGVLLQFNDAMGSAWFEGASLADMPTVAEHMKPSTRIRQLLLRFGELTSEQLQQRLPDMTVEAIKKQCGRMPDIQNMSVDLRGPGIRASYRVITGQKE